MYSSMLMGEGTATVIKSHHYIEVGVQLMQIAAYLICKEFLGCCLNHHISASCTQLSNMNINKNI
jgi:hypothetical protein